MTLDELKELIAAQDAQRIPHHVHGILVSQDVYAYLQKSLDHVDTKPALAWTVTVVKWLDKGTIIPVDVHGRPIPSPETDVADKVTSYATSSGGGSGGSGIA